jgi:Domain of unknown function (DUF4232)
MTASARTTRHLALAAGLTCAAALAAGCGGSPAPAPTHTVTITPNTSASATASGTATATGAAAPTTPAIPAGPPPCPTRSLGVKLGLSQGTAGSVYQVIDFANISNVTCSLYGYPGVSAGNGTPVTQVGLAASEMPTPPRELVTLAPGAVANALLRIVDAGNFPASKCNMVTTKWLQVYPPNQTTPVYLRFTTQMCTKPVQILSVSVVQPGSGGNA